MRKILYTPIPEFVFLAALVVILGGCAGKSQQTALSCWEKPANEFVGYGGVQYFSCRGAQRKTVHVYNVKPEKVMEQLREACCR